MFNEQSFGLPLFVILWVKSLLAEDALTHDYESLSHRETHWVLEGKHFFKESRHHRLILCNQLKDVVEAKGRFCSHNGKSILTHLKEQPHVVLFEKLWCEQLCKMTYLFSLSLPISPIIVNGLPCLGELQDITLPLFGIETSKKLWQRYQNTFLDRVNVL